MASCHAYVGASEGPRSGSGKKKELFQAQVREIYDKELENIPEWNPNVTYPPRTGAAIVQRYRKVGFECLKSEGVVATIKSKKPTGSPSEKDSERAALAVYNGKAAIDNIYTYPACARVDIGASFPFKDALWYLGGTYTWNMAIMSQKSKKYSIRSCFDEGDYLEPGRGKCSPLSGGNLDVTNTDDQHSSEDSPREIREMRLPTGTKRVGEISQQVATLHRGADGFENIAEASNKRAKFGQVLLLVEQKKPRIALFSLTESDPEIQEKFLRLTQLRALSELEQELASIQTNRESQFSNRLNPNSLIV